MEVDFDGDGIPDNLTPSAVDAEATLPLIRANLLAGQSSGDHGR